MSSNKGEESENTNNEPFKPFDEIWQMLIDWLVLRTISNLHEALVRRAVSVSQVQQAAMEGLFEAIK